MNKIEKLELELEELEEQLDLLYRQQNDILGYGGDDLWVREKIAEVEDIIRDVRGELDDQA